VLSFLGAAGTVTGSRFLIDTARARVLVDAGLFQGLKQLRLRNWEPFPVDPSSVDAVVVTHAHVDHVGYLPALVRAGFRGPVACTGSTAALAAIVLPDAGRLQEDEAAYANRMGFSKHDPALPLFTEADALRCAPLFAPLALDVEREVAPGVHVTLRHAGHILGAATVSVRLADHGDRRVVFSGDLGRGEHPLLDPPAPVGDCDLLVMESTYGDRRHDEGDTVERLADAVRRTVSRGGTVLIPAFAVDRTEVVLLHLHELQATGRIPTVPVVADSPMALAALGVYRAAIERGDPGVRTAVATNGDPFGSANLTEVHEAKDSRALAEVRYPTILVSASGMATGGRVVHHLARLLPDHRNTVLLIGFQAPGTRGRRLAEGARTVKMLGRYVNVAAEVVDLGGFSVHADADDLVRWVDSSNGRPETVHLVHGEPAASAALQRRLDEHGVTAVVARHGDRVRLD
jgi:metallo-beta-lactamase family protein